MTIEDLKATSKDENLNFTVDLDRQIKALSDVKEEWLPLRLLCQRKVKGYPTAISGPQQCEQGEAIKIAVQFLRKGN